MTPVEQNEQLKALLWKLQELLETSQELWLDCKSASVVSIEEAMHYQEDIAKYKAQIKETEETMRKLYVKHGNELRIAARRATAAPKEATIIPFRRNHTGDSASDRV
ncbi:hypothetical protein UFOVP75_118 [uncultured Caudovirales phage]|uniref:Uncharacterized protein n=1 Tax=uncultured Caudovirales phage TaxID=2100421 RepID=A0A6J5KYZ7_9CAUD|nr:hypothetical protein UFOVP75_118 [uncultured Caudovirales phage]